MKAAHAAAVIAAAALITGCSASAAPVSAAQRETAAACHTLRAWELHPTNPLAADITQDPVRFRILREAGHTQFAAWFRHWLADIGTAPAVTDATMLQRDCKAAGAQVRGLFGPGT